MILFFETKMSDNKSEKTFKKSFIIRYMAKRMIRYLFSIYLTFTISFFLFRSIPGNPIRRFLETLWRQYGLRSIEDQLIIKEYERIFGLEGDIFNQYINYMRELILHCNMGPSFVNYPTPSQVLIMRALPWTIGLLGLATVIAWIFGNILGSIAGWRRGSKFDEIITPIALVTSQIPYYIVALLLILVIGYYLGWLPTRGAFSPSVTNLLEFIWSIIIHGMLPALSIVIVSIAGWFISMRALIITVLGEDYITFARTKGLKSTVIWKNYALRNALLPQVTGLAMSLGFVVNGTYIVEYLFTYPGIGRLFVTALNLADYNTVNGIVLISIISVLTAMLLIDLLIPFIDPRVKSRV
jgi:peptide/nickel transport system permease protein